jgi:hypothetical protein
VYALLDRFFFVFHSFIIIFVLFGWIWKKTRVANLIVILLTAFSWFILGIWYGFGYCFCTDWHYRVRIALGFSDMPPSYVKFLIDTLLGTDLNSRLVDISTLSFFFLAFGISFYINIYQRLRRSEDEKVRS